MRKPGSPRVFGHEVLSRVGILWKHLSSNVADRAVQVIQQTDHALLQARSPDGCEEEEKVFVRIKMKRLVGQRTKAQ